MATLINLDFDKHNQEGFILNGKIIEDMKLCEVMEKYPKTREVFLKHGMPNRDTQSSCPTETIVFFSRMHDAEIQILLDELNEAAGL